MLLGQGVNSSLKARKAPLNRVPQIPGASLFLGLAQISRAISTLGFGDMPAMLRRGSAPLKGTRQRSESPASGTLMSRPEPRGRERSREPHEDVEHREDLAVLDCADPIAGDRGAIAEGLLE